MTDDEIKKLREEIAELKRLVKYINFLTRNFGPPEEKEKA